VIRAVFVTVVLVVALLGAGVSATARAEPPQPFQEVAARVVEVFSTETTGVRNVRIDIRRRDMAPEASVTLVGVLGMDIKPKDGSAWYSIRLLFGQRDGRWSFLKAYHELPSEGPVWAEASVWYRTVAERALGR
jgi:hypothetical protein